MAGECERRAILVSHVADPQLSGMLADAAELRSKGRMTYGMPAFHIFRVRDERAALHDYRTILAASRWREFLLDLLLRIDVSCRVDGSGWVGSEWTKKAGLGC